MTLPAILAVDDAPANLAVIRGILGDEFLLKLATSGQKALDIAFVTPPDLILLDIMMPEMDGYEVCRRLRADQRTRDIPIIFVTAKTSLQDEVTGFEAGGSDFIRKPLAPPILLCRMRSLLAARQMPAFVPDTGDDEPSQEVMAYQSPHVEYHTDLDGYILYSRVLAPLPPACQQHDRPLDRLTDLLGWGQVSNLHYDCLRNGRAEAVVKIVPQALSHAGNCEEVQAYCVMELLRDGFLCQLSFGGVGACQ